MDSRQVALGQQTTTDFELQEAIKLYLRTDRQFCETQEKVNEEQLIKRRTQTGLIRNAAGSIRRTMEKLQQQLMSVWGEAKTNDQPTEMEVEIEPIVKNNGTLVNKRSHHLLEESGSVVKRLSG